MLANSRLRCRAQLPHSQKCSTVDPPSGDGGRSRLKTRPSRRYRNGARQAGLEHSETIGGLSIVRPHPLGGVRRFCVDFQHVLVGMGLAVTVVTENCVIENRFSMCVPDHPGTVTRVIVVCQLWCFNKISAGSSTETSVARTLIRISALRSSADGRPSLSDPEQRAAKPGASHSCATSCAHHDESI